MLATVSPQNLTHPAFEVVTMKQHEIGIEDPLNIAWRRLVQMRIDSGAHQRGDICVRTTECPHRSGKHLGGTENLHLSLRRESAGRSAAETRYQE